MRRPPHAARACAYFMHRCASTKVMAAAVRLAGALIAQ